ncbi:MAG: tRNA (adenosine(37)-N6)-dimethylallyltransferase MiaA [Firmicutes bacterium]|nr:tRNA (adenosine(37)-N6)-dimethylallyltransferase MiaA [Candidatus Fiminaster equi]
MGKTDTALAVAKAFNCEIINGDAFQCYKEMEIGVAKPPKEYFNVVPHHLFSFVDVEHEYSIAEYQENLRNKINEIISKGKNVVIVGGSGLYIRSALYDYEFLKQSEIDLSKYEKMTNAELHDALEEIDPKEAEKIHMNNRKRVLRAIEIYLSQGKTKTEVIEAQEHKVIYDAKFYVRNMDRDLLYSLINKRVDKMMQLGLFDEVKNLVKKYGKNCKSLQAIGYKELIPVLDGEYSLEEGVELIKKNSRNYAKRQVTYIKHQFPVNFYENTEDLMEILKK